MSADLIPLPSAAVLVVGRIADFADQALFPEESPLAADMTSGRLREFRAGRAIARRALAELGKPPVGLPWGANGEPIWPHRVCGSLSHTWSHVAAAVGSTEHFLSLGVDLDDERELDSSAAEDLMTATEEEAVVRAGIATTTAGARGMIFAAKEALYKCQYPVTLARDLDFHDVRLVYRDRRMGAEYVGSPNAELSRLCGSVEFFFYSCQLVRSVCALLRQ